MALIPHSAPRASTAVHLQSPAPTMSSREIADLVKSRHADVCRTIERLIEKSVIGGCAPTAYTHEQNGQQYTEYHLDKRSSLIVVAQLCPEFTARIVDRWQELEAQTKPQAPAELSRMQILQLAMESEQARIQAEAERDEALRTKVQIGSRREATAMASASAARREAARLKEQLGACAKHATVRAVEGVTGHAFDWLPLRRWCKANGVSPTSVADPLYGQVKAWPAKAWADCHKVDLAKLFGGDA